MRVYLGFFLCVFFHVSLGHFVLVLLAFVACRMALLPMPLNDLEGHFCCLKPFLLLYLVKRSTNLIT